ncbi:MAG: hypothetical protein ACFFDI_15180 [Promethearchaeota archaeon]
MTENIPVKPDHEGVPVCKIVFWGPTMAGKTTALTIAKVLKSLEDPENVYKFLKLEDPTGRTLFFDQAIFGVGKDSRTGKPFLKYHIFTVPGQDRHKSQRKVVLQGAHGLVVVIDSEKVRWEENKKALAEIGDLVGERLSSGSLPYYLILNKMDLPGDQRISSIDVSRLLVEAGIDGKMGNALARIQEASCINARDDLKKLLATAKRAEIINEYGYLKKSSRPESVRRIINPIENLIKEVLFSVMRQKKKQSAN